MNEETCVTVISQNANDIVPNRSHGVDTSCLDCFHMPNEFINGHSYTRASPQCNNAITYNNYYDISGPSLLIESTDSMIIQL